MDRIEAWKIIEECRNWNPGCSSVSLAFYGKRTKEDDVLDAKREALKRAYLVIGEIEPEVK